MYPAELKKILKFSIGNNLPVLVLGEPGIGKTEIIKSVGDELSHPIFFKHPVVDEAIDYKGLPGIVNGQAEFLPYGDLRILIEAKEKTIIFIDDFGQSELPVQKALMQLLLERTINGQRISDHIIFIAASNRNQDKAGVGYIIEPLKSRFKSIVKLEVRLEDWTTWAINKGLPHELIQFIRFKPDMLFSHNPTREIVNSANPRTVASVGNWMLKGLPKEFELEVFQGAAGESFAIEFMSFLQIARELPDPREILANPLKAEIPNNLSAKAALSGALAHHVTAATLPNMFAYLNRFEPEYVVKAAKEVVSYKDDLLFQPAFMEFAKKYSELFNFVEEKKAA